MIKKYSEKKRTDGTRSRNSLFNGCVNVVRDGFSLDTTI